MKSLPCLLSLILLVGSVGCTTPSTDAPKPSKSAATLDRQPMPSLRVQPIYPFELKRAGIKGEAEVEFIVDSQGVVRDATVVRATHKKFGQASVEAILKWQYRHGIKSGRAVSARMRQTFFFNIEEVPKL